MGNSQSSSSSSSCSKLCLDDSSMMFKKDVIIMKEDGETMKFRQGTRVSDVVAVHPFHKVIRCCSDRTALPDDFALNAKSLYFLLPQELPVCDATYRSLMKCALSKQLILAEHQQLALKVDHHYRMNDDVGSITTSTARMGDDDPKVSIGEDDDDDNYKLVRHCTTKKYPSSQWAPGLHTIPEIISPVPTPAAAASS